MKTQCPFLVVASVCVGCELPNTEKGRPRNSCSNDGGGRVVVAEGLEVAKKGVAGKPGVRGAKKAG